MEEVIKQFGAFGIGGLFAAVVVWVLHHVITKTLPNMAERFTNEIRAERDVCQKNHETVIQQMNDQHEQNLSAHRDTRHEVSNLAHAAGLKKAIEDLRKDKA